MGRVRLLWGTGTGPTALSSYDAALAAANVQDYNLIRVSSVLPAETTVDLVGAAPDLGPIGNTLTVVEARETNRVIAPESVDASADGDADGIDHASLESGVPARGTACAGLGWARIGSGRGIVYEGTGTDPGAVRRRIDRGLRAGCALREFSSPDFDRVVLTTDGTTAQVERGTDTIDSTPVHARDPSDDPEPNDGDEPAYVTAVVLAAYGTSNPIS